MSQIKTEMKSALSLVVNYPLSSKPPHQPQELKQETCGSSNNEKASLTELPNKTICDIWHRMGTIYGYKWASHMGVADGGDGVLTDAAKTWKKSLVGITLEQLKYGFDVLIFKNHDWPPSLPEFRKLCLSNVPSGVPGVDEVLKVLVSVQGKNGTLASRYKHPLIFAISQEINMFELRTAKTLDAKRLINAAYEKFIDTGWPDCPEHAHIEQKAIARERNKSVGLSAFRLIRGDL